MRGFKKKKEYIVLVHIQRPHTCVLKLQERAQKSAAYCCICVSLILYCSICVTLVLYCSIRVARILLYMCPYITGASAERRVDSLIIQLAPTGLLLYYTLYSCFAYALLVAGASDERRVDSRAYN